VKQHATFSNANCKKFLKICLKEFRHVLQQRADILNIFYDGEYNINYHIWLIINERSKECVLLVANTLMHFSWQVIQFHRKLLMVKSVQSACALNTLHIRWVTWIQFPTSDFSVP
jgi:hypothetical protein